MGYPYKFTNELYVKYGHIYDDLKLQQFVLSYFFFDILYVK